MKIGIWGLIRDHKNPSAGTSPNVGVTGKMRMSRSKLIHDNENPTACINPCDLVFNAVPSTICKIIREDQPDLPPCEKSCPREARSEFKSEAAHFDRGGSSHGRCARCHKLGIITLESPLVDCLDGTCNCASAPQDSDPAIVDSNDCEFSPCVRDSNICGYFEGYLVTTSGESFAKCLRVI